MSNFGQGNISNKSRFKGGILKPLAGAIREMFMSRKNSKFDISGNTDQQIHISPPKKSILFESIEPRVLMSADAAISISGAIDAPGEIDQYGFTLTSDIKVVFDSLTNNPNFNWSLTGPRGTVVDARSFSNSDSVNFNGTPVLDLTAGEYTLAVDGNQDNTGEYKFRLLDLKSATEVTPGTPVTGQLALGNETNAYKFNVAAGDRFYFDMQSSSSTASWRLLDPFGRSVFTPSYLSSGDVDVTTLLYSGEYTLLIEGNVNATTVSDYTFNVQQVVDDVAAMVVGSTTNGAISTAGQQDRFTFTLVAPSQLYFDSLTNNNYLNWSLIGPRGPVITQRNFNNSDANQLSGALAGSRRRAGWPAGCPAWARTGRRRRCRSTPAWSRC